MRKPSLEYMYKLYSQHKDEFEKTHEFTVYMFYIPVEPGKLERVCHFVLGAGFTPDYDAKHCCIGATNFWKMMDDKMSGKSNLGIIENGDILHIRNYCHILTKQKVTSMLLTNPVGRHKSEAFYCDPKIYESIRNFDPSRELDKEI